MNDKERFCQGTSEKHMTRRNDILRGLREKQDDDTTFSREDDASKRTT